jgi:type II secretory pathway component PulF
MLGGSDKSKAALYRQLATMENAGIPLTTSLSRLAQGGAGKRLLGPVLARVDKGETVSDAFREAGSVTRLESAVVAAGAEAGTLPTSFERLADIFESRAAAKLKLAMSLAYPLLLVHAACVLPAVPTLVQDKGGLFPFLFEALTPIVVLWGVCIGSLLLYRSSRAANPRAVDTVVLAIPLIGTIARKTSASVALRALALLYGNGVNILKALALAGETSPNAAVGAVFEQVSDRVNDGEDVGAAFAGTGGVIPTIAIDMIATGSRSGQLDASLNSACDMLDSEAKTAQMVLAGILGGAAFLFAAGMVAYKVVSFWSNLYSGIGKF